MKRDSDPWDDSEDIGWGCFAFVLIIAGGVLLAFIAAYLRG